MEKWEREWIRDLARKKLEMANTPEQKELARLWTVHNDGKSERPMIHFEMGTVMEPEFHYTCRCTSDDARQVEADLGRYMQNQVMVGDDYCVTGDFFVGYNSWIRLFDLTPERINVPGIGYHINPVLENLDTLDILNPSAMDFDETSADRALEYYGDLFGDILDVKKGQGSLYCVPTNLLVHLMSMENMFVEMCDNPENFIEMMNRLADDYCTYFTELEKRKMLTPCCGNNLVHQGSFAFSDTMKKEGKITLKDVWGFMDSQETVDISPDMFHEMIFPAYKKISSLFGRLAYGCCEPVHSFWEKSLSTLENLCRISISPWCDEEYMGAALRGKGIIYQRKPSPLFVGGTSRELDEAAFREHIRTTMRAAEGCPLEITFRDVYTLNGNLNKPRRAVEIVREEIENTWRG